MRTSLGLALAGILGAAFLAGCVEPGDGYALDDDSDGLEPRGPIRLMGAASLRDPESGVRSGNGTRDDPYVIAGWFIDLQAPRGGGKAAGITLADLDVHVHVRNCKIKRGTDDVAIHVLRSKHVKVDGCKVVSVRKPHVRAPPTGPSTNLSPPPTNASLSAPANLSSAAQTTPVTTGPQPQESASVASSPDVLVLETPSEPAIHIEDSANVTVVDTRVEGPADSDSADGAALVEIEGSSEVQLEDSRVSSGGGDGVHVEGSTNVTVTDTQVSGNQGNGVALSNSTAVTVANNTISQNAGDGVHAENVGTSTVADNDVTGNGGYGVALGGTQNEVVHNEVVGNGAGGGGGILLETGSTIVFANGLHDNENYGIVVMPETSDVQLADNSATGDDGGDKIIVPDPQDASLFTGPNEGQVEAPGPDFDPRPPPKGRSPGLGAGVMVAAVLLALGGASLWWVRRER